MIYSKKSTLNISVNYLQISHEYFDFNKFTFLNLKKKRCFHILGIFLQATNNS